MTVRTDSGETVQGRMWDTGYFVANDGRVYHSWEVKVIDDAE